MIPFPNHAPRTGKSTARIPGASRLATRPAFYGRKGFALVVTLSLMVLLAILSVGLLSLSFITLRTSGNTTAMAEAKQNARLSMQMAIAQLQLLSGQDTRITAPRLPASPGDPIDSVVPLTGVWRSWEGADREANGKPKAPDYASKQQGGDPSAAPGGSANGRFLGWLASSTAAGNVTCRLLVNLASTRILGPHLTGFFNKNGATT